jgi:murein DD-endopeptidase MepM/ murein hydrolase activator NlpD
VKPHQRPRVGFRRDDKIRRIKSDTRPMYPGVDVAAPVDSQPVTSAAPTSLGEEPRLAPALDAGIAVQSRAERAAADAVRRQRTMLFGIAGAVVALTIGGMTWHGASDRMAALSPLVGPSSPTATSTASAAEGGQASKATPAATPIFATCKGVKLALPLPVKSLTEIGFHQASYSWAIPMKTSMKDADMDQVAKIKSTGRDLDEQPDGPDGKLTGQVLRMWRNRPGKPDTAVDVGAKKAGTLVLSPVTGTVVRIKEYKLYGRYPDYEMHIIPDDTTDIDVVLIHISDLQCEVGDRVEAGLTPVAKVRKLSDKFKDQLARYTKTAGDHVHLQVNDSGAKGYKGLQGAIDPSEYPSSTPQDSL